MDVSEEGQSTRCLLLLLLCANAGSKSCQTPTTPDPKAQSMPKSTHNRPRAFKYLMRSLVALGSLHPRSSSRTSSLSWWCLKEAHRNAAEWARSARSPSQESLAALESQSQPPSSWSPRLAHRERQAASDPRRWLARSPSQESLAALESQSQPPSSWSSPRLVHRERQAASDPRHRPWARRWPSSRPSARRHRFPSPSPSPSPSPTTH